MSQEQAQVQVQTCFMFYDNKMEIAKGTAHRHVCFCFMLEYVRSNRYSTQAQVQVQMCFMSTNTGMSQEQEQVQVRTSFRFYVLCQQN